MGEILGFLFLIYIVWLFIGPADTNSTSYRLGRGVGNKTKKFGKWLMDD